MLKEKIDVYIEERPLELIQDLQQRNIRYAGLVRAGRDMRRELKEGLGRDDWVRVKDLLRTLYCQMEVERGYLYVKGFQDRGIMKEYLKGEFLHVYFEDDTADDDF